MTNYFLLGEEAEAKDLVYRCVWESLEKTGAKGENLLGRNGGSALYGQCISFDLTL